MKRPIIAFFAGVITASLVAVVFSVWFSLRDAEWIIGAIKNPGGMALGDIQADMNAKRYDLAKEKIDVLFNSWQRFSSGPDSCSGVGISDIMVTFRQMPGGINATNVESGGAVNVSQYIIKDSSNGITRTRVAFGPDPVSDYDSIHDGEKAQAAFSGGDGSSIKDAVVITATNEATGYRAAYIWSHEHYPGSRLLEEGFDYDNSGRYYGELKIATSDGKQRTVFFETTSFFGNGK